MKNIKIIAILFVVTITTFSAYANEPSWSILVFDKRDNTEKSYTLSNKDKLSFSPVKGYTCEIWDTDSRPDGAAIFYSKIITCFQEGSNDKMGSMTGCRVQNNKVQNPSDNLLVFRNGKPLFFIRMYCEL